MRKDLAFVLALSNCGVQPPAAASFYDLLSPKSFRRPRSRLGGFFFAVPRWRGCLERAQQAGGRCGNFIDGAHESSFVGFRRFVEPADLSYELQRRCTDLVIGNRRLEVEEHLDVSAHSCFIVAISSQHTTIRAFISVISGKVYSSRSTTMGSTRVARRAGM